MMLGTAVLSHPQPGHCSGMMGNVYVEDCLKAFFHLRFLELLEISFLSLYAVSCKNWGCTDTEIGDYFCCRKGLSFQLPASVCWAAFGFCLWTIIIF